MPISIFVDSSSVRRKACEVFVIGDTRHFGATVHRSFVGGSSGQEK